MPRLVKLVSIALAAVVLGGCGSGPLAPDALAGGSSSPTPGDTPPSGDTSSHFPGDTPPSGSPTRTSTPSSTESPYLPHTCNLVTQKDITNMSKGSVGVITYPAQPQETSGNDPSGGLYSRCFIQLNSQLSDGNGGKDIVGGEVTLKYQTAGASFHFPAQPGDKVLTFASGPYDGYLRFGRVYVRVGDDALLTVEVAIPNYHDTATDRSLQDSWAESIAATALFHIPHP
ncbi:MAG TPA: hypothetical protein VKB69_04885 [Micromonosporaceae bacterium]|nr:hypothetical protein [Micromonosporaceae bacterium]